MSGEDIQRDVGGVYSDAQLHNEIVFLYRQGSAFQIVAAIVHYSLSDNGLHALTNVSYDLQAVIKAVTLASGQNVSAQLLKGLDDLGPVRVGYTAPLPQPAGPALRTDISVVRRSCIAGYVWSYYPDNTRPPMKAVNLARILDSRAEAAQTPK